MKQGKRGLLNRILSFFSPLDAALLPRSGYRVEIEGVEGETRALVSGGERILLCCEEEVALLSGKRRLRFFGMGLTCLTYEGGVAEIAGRITGFSVEVEPKQ